MEKPDSEAVGRDRVIAALVESTACSPEEVRQTFAREYARLAASAKVRTHLQALTASNVRGILRRAERGQDRAD